jgi:hypothetical protein
MYSHRCHLTALSARLAAVISLAILSSCGSDSGAQEAPQTPPGTQVSPPAPAPTPPPVVVEPPPAPVPTPVPPPVPAPSPKTPTAFELRAKDVTTAWSSKSVENSPQRIVYKAVAQYAAGQTDDANANIDKTLAFDLSLSTQGEISAFVGQPLAYAVMRYGAQMGVARKATVIAKIKSFDPLGGASENHKLLYRSMGYIIAATSPDTPWAAYTNQDVLNKSKQYLLNEADVAFRLGLWEFDSSNYIQFHINSWILVHDFSPDPEMKAIAKISLDRIFAGIAPEILKGGAWAASTSRSYSPSNSNFQDDGQNITFTWLAFGHDKKFIGDTRTVILATSDYRIPDQILAAANRPDQMLPFANREKHSRPNSGKTYFYKYSWIENDYGIYSTYDGNRAADTSGSLGQAHRWGVTWNDGYFVLKDIVDTKYSTGDTVDNQVFQHENTILGVSISPAKMTRKELDITRKIVKSGWEFLEGGNAVYIAFYSASGNRAWVVETAKKSQFASLELFSDHIVKNARVDSSGILNSKPSLKYTTGGGAKVEMAYQTDKTYVNKSNKINGSATNYQNWPTIENPWMAFDESKVEMILKDTAFDYRYNMKNRTILKVAK